MTGMWDGWISDVHARTRLNIEYNDDVASRLVFDANSSSNYFNTVSWSNDNDPSTFEKDSNLKNAFWAVAYTPFGSQIPDCGSNLGESR